jgi:phenylpropionate dioxygenase-like ring-hydroxylating dioxygenase large terminal subunit
MLETAPTSRVGWKAPLPKSRRNYPMNCWWVAALSTEVDRTLMGRWLLNTAVLLYRTEDGRVAALEDRCPHRGAPLSIGSLKGDTVQCGYHGFTFAPDGACIKVPSMKSAVSAIRVRSFPVIEKAPFIWVYLGDPDALDSVPAAPDLPWTTDPSFAVVTGRINMAANFMLLKENVLDLTHFGYVHAATFKITDWVDPPKVTVEGDTVTYRQSFVGSPLPPPFAEALARPAGMPFNRENYGSFVSPALQVANVDFIDPARPAEVAGRFRICHATTPIDADHMLYYYALGRDHGTAPDLMNKFEALSKVGFDEDKLVIEAIQAARLKDPTDPADWEVSVKSDTAGIQGRRALSRWMERETS